MLVESIKLSECYVVCFDESLNNETQNCEMDVLIRFFDAKDNKVKTRYLDSQHLGHSTHSDLIRGYNEAVKDLDENKLVQISMDGPNINLKMLQKINEEHTANELSSPSSNISLKLWTAYRPWAFSYWCRVH